MIEEFYPINENMKFSQGIWQMSAVMKLKRNLEAAKMGDIDAERRIMYRLGSIRRSVDFKELDASLVETIKECATYLRSKGRKVDFSNKDPRYWITRRDGTPRW